MARSSVSRNRFAVAVFLLSACTLLSSCGDPDNRNNKAANKVAPPIDQVSACHELASHKADRTRFSAGVSDEDIAPGAAIPACEQAVEANPSNPLLRFELGRSLWAGGRDMEAVHQFALAADSGHGGAMKYLGDAYVEGRGLPEGQTQSLEIGADWYLKSDKAGFAEGYPAYLEAQNEIRKSVFDPSLFQNGELMKVLYTGDFSTTKNPIALAYYAQGVIKGLESEVPSFNDQQCAPLVGRLGKQVLDFGVFIGAVRKATMEDGTPTGDRVISGVLEYALGDYFADQGRRSAMVLADSKVLGCDTPITKKIVENIMITSQNNRAL